MPLGQLDNKARGAPFREKHFSKIRAIKQEKLETVKMNEAPVAHIQNDRLVYD
jgi:hypothetical protein